MMGSPTVPLLLLAALVAPLTCEERYQVVVVGAGVAGFTAAATLLTHNVTDLVVLEAADRIGGRIHTVQFGGVPIDKGAEFVHGEIGNAVFELVNPHGFLQSYRKTFFVQDDMTMFVNTSGHVFNSSVFSPLVDEAYDLLDDEEMSKTNGSIADYVNPRLDSFLSSRQVAPPLQEAIRHLVELLGAIYNADTLDRLGARGTFDNLDTPGDLSLKWRAGTNGCKTLFDILSKKFPNPQEELPVVNKTLLNKQVTSISREGGKVVLRTQDGGSYVADHAIVTPSLGVLKKHAAELFSPPLSQAKTDTIENLGFGCVAKVFVLFPTRWWPQNISMIMPLFSKVELQDFVKTTTHGSWTAYNPGFHPVLNQPRMLCVWLVAEQARAMEALTEDQVRDGVMEMLDRLLADRYQIPRPEAILRTSWCSNPWTLGTYSYRTLASDRRNLSHRGLADPVLEDDGRPAIMFAGEATHPVYWSTVHGALESGRREANYLINYLNKHQPLQTAS